MTVAFAIIGMLAALCACITAGAKFVQAVKKSWAKDIEHTRALNRNTQASDRNTEAIEKLDLRLADHEVRLQRLEGS